MSRMLVGACLLLIAVAAAGNDVSVRVTLRDTGYLLGDLIDERVELRLPASMRIDPDSLPLPGRVMPWLEMRRARLEPPRADGVQEIIVTYQIFAEAEEATRAPLPACSAIQLSAASKAFETMTLRTIGSRDGRSPELATKVTSIPSRSATFRISGLTGQASAST